ncbi:NAD(P)-dependent oxidoreductase [Actinophytocola oryzae]|uniref:3-hydroxyisobutyrate dehydrogenase-like beta-hydroxyacid dehydrogenase n=1 Tax=Actinophytocola oryzae TaxID=502181 RepID=A0A4V3FUP2_9PSEU|nr:NAD(P)-binding domain-containing protein [Actinophytocola oryzae]TDV56001.1 3-hydroxyisobutyrate dehydrogenase-like beta-hydroxyacid dehydrogenase [Actinophytocola oryzae]
MSVAAAVGGLPSPVGFVGAGHVGAPMVERLLVAGHAVRLYARRAEVRDRLAAAGAEPVDHPRRLGACPVVVSCLYDDEQMLDVLPGVVRSLEPDAVLVSHTTGHPSTVELLAASGRASVVDAPFSGTAELVRTGRLTVYLGGKPGAVGVARRVVGAYANTVIDTGARGTALRTKLVNNLLFAAIAQVTLNGLAAGRALGIDEDTLLAALAVGSGGSTAAGHIAARGGAERFSAAVVPFLRKDLAACRDLAEDTGADLSALFAVAHDGPMNVGEPVPEGSS